MLVRYELICRCLCEAGASMNVLNVKGEDAVHVAVDRCNDAEVRDLLAFRADPHTVTAATDVDPECSQSTTSYRPVLSTSKLNTGAAAITKDHYHSVASELDRSSLVSRESTSLLNSNCNNDETYSWTDLLWPQPKNIYPDAEDKNISFPNDSRIKIYFDASSEGDASEMMRIIQLFTSLLSSVGLEVEYRGYKVGVILVSTVIMTEESSSTWNGAVLCGIFESDQLKGSYSLSINECTDIRLFANDYYGFKFGFVTLITEVRSDNSNERSLSGVSMHHASEYESTLFNESYKSKIPAVPSGVIPCVTIRDNPDSCVRAIFFDFSGCSVLNIDTMHTLPAYVTLCIDAVDVIALPSSLYPLNIVIRVNSNQPGYLSNALHSIINTLITANQFAQKLPTSGIMMCNVSTGCEIMPISLAYIPQVASLGIAWNRSIHIPHFSSILPRITAEHFLLNGNMEVLFIQACTLGHVENEVTRLSNGGVESHSKGILWCFKARIQVKARHLKAFVEAQAGTSCDLEVALVLAEVEFVTELMTLICRLGQSLCVHQMKITRVPSTTDINAIAVNDYNEKSCPSNNVNFNYDQFANFHLSNLPVTARTDLANCLNCDRNPKTGYMVNIGASRPYTNHLAAIAPLLKIRRNFQNIWLSRNMASTLPNALKLFDNLFHALLPADMQSYSDILL
ncbi:unnamed protein product [Anisakis simplex]|uniref:ANK_REP_REGION domain-containing protein n=1 Tax=Anisakis simplex TaxID=6269 RepID=A0A0M3JS70_ANISI|nr:unnamed protein product [Anisakis simplex]